MWSGELGELYHHASRLKNGGHYRESLTVANQLLEQLPEDDVRYPLVLGCVKAVDLRHLGRTEEAHAAFSRADLLAARLFQPAVRAYVQNDWASMYEPMEAVVKIHKALRLLNTAISTPDPDRHVDADKAYFLASIARYQAKAGDSAAVKTITNQRQVLHSFAYGTHPYYKGAYLVVLGWEVEARRQHNWRQLALVPLTVLTITEVIRQRQWRTLLRLIR